MTARILVVDDILANLKLMEARLASEYFDVRTALSGRAALDIVGRERVDLVLLDIMMPDMSGLDVCRQLKSQSETAHVPVIMLTALDQPDDRVKGLECGADDFLTKPVSEIALLVRVKSLLRLKAIADELNLRAAALSSLGIDPAQVFRSTRGVAGRLLVVDDQPASRRRIETALGAGFQPVFETDFERAAERGGAEEFDLFIVSLSLGRGEGLRLCARLKALDRARNTPILLLANPDETTQLLRGLDLGVNDYVICPVDANELRARVRTQLKRKLYSDRLRSMVSSAMELALTDALTGLHNRRHFETHLKALIARYGEAERDIALLLFDIDRFKGINDTFGHDAGDDVLKEFAVRLRKAVRGFDLVARLGGEEFVVVMPETDAALANEAAERVRHDVESAPFQARGAAIEVTVSVGVARFRGRGDTIDGMLKRADEALYRAKRSGRNRVVAEAA